VKARLAARVIVLDETDFVLLLEGCDPARPDAGTWWFTPGGGVDDGESIEDAARRELREETGYAAGELGEPVFHRTTEFSFLGEEYRQTEFFFCVRVARFDARDDEQSDLERRAVLGARWWSIDDIATTSETIHPERFAELLGQLTSDRRRSK
jgi:8-oxo-dGTP pyrophosphatase MutT (NUDIX family)